MPGACRAGGARPKEPPTPEDLLLAAAYVSDAQYNRNVLFETSPRAVRLYYFYNHWAMRAATYFFIFLDLSLALFEEPALLPLPASATVGAELLCLAAFLGRLVHFAKVTPQTAFWRDTKNVCIVGALALTLADLVIYGSLAVADIRGVRWSRALRPVFLVNFPDGRQIRRALRSLRNALPDVLRVLLLFLFSLLLFALMALKLFGGRGLKTAQGSPYFSSLLESIFELYVLVTTANSPDVMVPAYERSRWACLFFAAFVVVNTYVFVSVFLAVVYHNYRRHLKNEIRQLAYLKRHKMVAAFNLLKVQAGSESVVEEATWKRLVRAAVPGLGASHLELLLRICDDGRTGHVDKTNFLRLPDLLNIRVVAISARTHPLEAWVPRVYGAPASRFVHAVVRHRVFVWACDAVVLANAVLIALEEKSVVVSRAEWLFLSLYVLEILLKLYTYEPRAYFGRTQFWNWFDALIVVAALVGTVAHDAIRAAGNYDSQPILDVVLVLRVLRLLRVVVSVQKFRVIVNALLSVGPMTLTFGGLVLVVYYALAIVGMELFQGRVHFLGPNATRAEALVCGNPALSGSAFARSRYCTSNFNDLASALVVLMELTVVNQWHVLAGGFAQVTHPAAMLYFVVVHVVVVILVVNIFTAVILEVFFVAYSLEKSEVETAIEKKIQELGVGIPEADVEGLPGGDAGDGSDKTALQGLYFRIASKKYRTVDTLLQRMFESEIAPDDEGPTLDEILSGSPSDMYLQNPSYEEGA
ncbi:two pore channel protein 2-like [Dasypus novemcinctus]|uniref:two pore channel protein 2-like n=1 Tax=Dasypus novemcinctus TaxID=9361 RepID=UPI00265F5FE2|nr:two pore channel protein 2-like [Dasypus novemcinctus]